MALTGTPGVGKSSVARRLAARWTSLEVRDLARRLGAGHRRGREFEVDLPRLRQAIRRTRPLEGVDLLVGHLAHLLPVRGAIVLRCHPRELAGRLRRAHRGNRGQRRANYLSEALDLVLVEALEGRLPVYEVDTTGRSIAEVAEEVDRRLRRRGRCRSGEVDWLADPAVTEELLDRVD